ncbi:MAG: hypothetical protein WA667_19870, partial [Candidatus Nitrosopolaris sp.]
MRLGHNSMFSFCQFPLITWYKASLGVSDVKENPPVRPKKKSTSGKKPVHSWEKLVCICILMVVFGSTYRN